ncbi:MAG TPA: ThiF family adenylyltransferase [Candidatus Sulfotelmatobacter sp.]|nr:ThiF family adenylyltransferase [Candidatus Sulfotelmatobacter sp.]
MAREGKIGDSQEPASAENDRYSRQILFRGIGPEGQRKLASARVAIVGCGATGSALAGLLARAGVGTLRIIDRDYVEPSNLQRQSLFDEQDAAESLPKAIAASRKIAAFNSRILVEPKVEDLVPANIQTLLEGMELILDGTDNFETRYLINDYAVEHAIPWIYSAAVGSYAVTLNVLPGQTACLACIFPDSPRGMVETCETSGILNSAVNLVASIAATEALKLLVAPKPSVAEAHVQEEDAIAALKRCATQKQAEPASPLRRTLLSFDVWTNEHAEISAAKPRPGCRACGERDFVHLAGEGRPHITLCGRNSVQIHERHRPIDFTEMDQRLQPHGVVRHNDFVLKFWHDPYEMTLFPDGRAIIKGTTDTAVARSLYARYVGS